MNDRPARPRVCVFAPIPPPVIGSSVAVQLLLDSPFSQALDVVHLNTVYSDLVADVGSVSFHKISRFVYYTRQLSRVMRSDRPPACVILIPTLTAPTFLRDVVAATIVRRQPRTKLVLWMHSARLQTVLGEVGPFWRRLIRGTLAKADHIVVLGDSLERQLEGIVASERITIIPNGVRVQRSDVVDHARDDGPLRVLFLSQMLEAKGWRELLVAAESICAVRADVRFDFYGEPGPGTPREEIVKDFAARATSGRIAYHGAVYGNAKMAALTDAHVFCLPSSHDHEALPIALLEAMAAGLAIVASAVGSVPDAARPGGCILVEPKRSDLLAAALTSLLDDRPRVRAMGEFNRRRAIEAFSHENTVRRWIDLVRELTGVESTLTNE